MSISSACSCRWMWIPILPSPKGCVSSMPLATGLAARAPPPPSFRDIPLLACRWGPGPLSLLSWSMLPVDRRRDLTAQVGQEPFMPSAAALERRVEDDAQFESYAAQLDGLSHVSFPPSRLCGA